MFAGVNVCWTGSYVSDVVILGFFYGVSLITRIPDEGKGLVDKTCWKSMVRNSLHVSAWLATNPNKSRKRCSSSICKCSGKIFGYFLYTCWAAFITAFSLVFGWIRNSQKKTKFSQTHLPDPIWKCFKVEVHREDTVHWSLYRWMTRELEMSDPLDRTFPNFVHIYPSKKSKVLNELSLFHQDI
jgi:hypothetical protein